MDGGVNYGTLQVDHDDNSHRIQALDGRYPDNQFNIRGRRKKIVLTHVSSKTSSMMVYAVRKAFD